MTDVTQAAEASGLGRVNKPLFAVTGGFILLFCAIALFDIDALGAMVDWGFNFSATYFGLYWQLLLLGTFLMGLVLCVLPGGKTVLGGLAKPEFSQFQWGSMIMCTLLAGGGVFWAAGEPIAHYLWTPPLYGDLTADPVARANAALAQSFMHWGFLAWAILGALTTVMLMHYHYDKGLPLAPRTLLYPVFGDKAINGPIGMIADASCIIAVVAGTVGPIGFLGLQVSYGLNALFGVPDTFATQATVIVGLGALYTISAMTGLSKGIQLLSKINVILAFLLLAFMLIAGPTSFILQGFTGGMGTYLSNFFGMAMFRGDAAVFGDPGWLGWWTVFFWGWFLGYGPLMAMFIAKVSRGRSIRSIIIMLAIVAPIVTNFWFTIIGGTGISLEQLTPGVISGPFEG
ncbi:MAG: BCCT family transporter, partial [Albidovulum sp.]